MFTLTIMNRSHHGSAADRRNAVRRAVGIAVACVAVFTASPAHAQTVRTWNVTSGTWSSTGSWDGALVPTASETAYFSSAAVGSSNATVIFSGTASVGGLSFNNSGSTTLRADTAVTRNLTLGTGGITVAAASGPVRIGESNQHVGLLLAGTQTWTNNSSSLLTLQSTIDTVSTDVTLTVTGSGSTTAASFTGAAGRRIAIVKQGTGVLSLNGNNNTYSGGFTLSEGTVRFTAGFGSAGALGTGTFTILGGAIDTNQQLTLNATPQVWNGDFAFLGSAGLNLGTGTVTLGGTRTVTNNSASALTVAGPIRDDGNGYGLTKSGTGTLILSSSSSYTGPTTISAGRLQLGVSAGGTTGSIAASSTVSIGSGASLAFGRTDDYGFANQITGAGSISLLATSGTTTLSNSSNDFSGGIAFNNSAGTATLQYTSPQVLGSGVVSHGSSNTSVLRAGVSGTIVNPLSIPLGGAFTFDTHSHSVTVSGTTGGGSVLRKIGSGTLTLTGTANSISYAANEGRLRLAGDARPGTTGTFASAISGSSGAVFEYASSVDGGISGALSGGFSFIKSSASSLRLSGANTFTGGLTLSEGTLVIDSASALGTGTLTITGGALDGGNRTLSTYNNPQAWNSDFTYIGAVGTLNTGTGAVTLSGSRTVTVNASSLTVAGPISDSGNVYGLTKAGAGALVLSASNSYSGPTTVTGGTLTVSNTFALGSGAAALDINGGVLALSNSGTGIHVSRSGPITLAGGTISSGTFTNTGSALDARSGAISSVLAGTLGLEKTTSGTVALSGANTFSGGVALSAGQLNLNAAAALGTGTFTITGGVLGNSAGSSVSTNTANAHRWDSDFSFVGPSALTLGSGTVTLGATRTVTVTSSTLTVAIPITGADGLGLTKTGAGTLVLSGSNGYMGPTTVNEGLLSVSGYLGGSGGTVVTGGTMAVSGTNAGTGPTSVSGGRLDLALPAGLYNGGTSNWTAANITVGSGGILSVRTGTGNFTTANVTTLLTNLGGLGGAVNNNGLLAGSSIGFDTTLATGTVGNIIADSTGAGGGAIGLIKYGANTLLLTGSNTYSGTTSITSGTLQIGTTGRIAGPIDNAAALLISNTSVTLPGPITGTGSLTTSGTGVVTLSSASSVLGGPITIPGGRLELAGGLAGSNNISLGSGTNVGTLRYVGSGNTSNRTIAITGSAGGTLDASGSGALNLSSGTISAANNTVVTLTGTSTNDNVIGMIAGTGVSVNKTGSGLWRLTGANSYTGGLTVREGTIVAGNSFSEASSPFGSGNATVGGTAGGIGGTAALLIEDGAIVDRSVTIAAAGAGPTQVAVLGGFGSGTVLFNSTGVITLNRSVTLQAANSGTVNFAKPWVNNGPDNVVTIGSASNAGTVELNRDLPATLAGVNVDTGTARLLSSNNRINSATPVTVGSGLGAATLDLNSLSQTLSNLTFAGNSGSIIGGTLRLNPTQAVAVTGTGHVISSLVALDAAASFNVNAASRLGISSAISGSFGLTKTGAGILELSAANTYTGPTEVSGGSLLVNGPLASAVTVQSGGLLGGSGALNGGVTVQAGGTLSPGNSPGLLTATQLVLEGATLMEIDGLSPRGGSGGYDAVDVSGLLTYGGNMVIDFGSSITTALADNTSFNLFDFGSFTGSFSAITTAADSSYYGGLTFANTGTGTKWTATKGTQTLEFTHSTGVLVIVPEPAAIALAGIGIAAAAYAVRRRR
jgi:fibronectin-binding autotransporter adhesin